MKFKYTKKVENGSEYECYFDTSVVWHCAKIPSTETAHEVLVLYTSTEPIETYKSFPRYNSKGVMNGYEHKKVTSPAVIEIHKPDEIKAFLKEWAGVII